MKFSKIHKITIPIVFSNLLKVPSKSHIFIEDIVYMNTKDEQTFRHCLNYDAHHKSLKVYAVTHTIHKTKIFSTIPLFHFLIFTSALSNVPVFRYVLDFFKLEKHIISLWINTFKKYATNMILGIYFIIDCATLKLYISKNFLRTCTFLIDSEGKSTLKSTLYETDFENCIKSFERFVEGHTQKALARSLFSVILKSGVKINCTDFTTVFKTKRNDLIKISIVDYIFCLLDENHTEPTLDCKVLHNYLLRHSKCVLPKTFIKNKKFLS